MAYAIKVQIAQQISIEVSGNEIAMVVKLLNEGTKKFLSSTGAARIEI
ncbi:hypothetical protein [Nitrosopumilus sp. Nsub]|nr:hypothetical protein [Nitrosopumilus sp. Nsub]